MLSWTSIDAAVPYLPRGCLLLSTSRIDRKQLLRLLWGWGNSFPNLLFASVMVCYPRWRPPYDSATVSSSHTFANFPNASTIAPCHASSKASHTTLPWSLPVTLLFSNFSNVSRLPFLFSTAPLFREAKEETRRQVADGSRFRSAHFIFSFIFSKWILIFKSILRSRLGARANLRRVANQHVTESLTRHDYCVSTVFFRCVAVSL